MVAPAYTDDVYVNHALLVNLDSSDAFEGPEKLLEIWFHRLPAHLPDSLATDGLRLIPLARWELILDTVQCKILSMKLTQQVDAYLLLELLLFVWPHKLILKTCGTTTTLLGLEALLEAAVEFARFGLSVHEVALAAHHVFYSRRLFMFPERQKPIHQAWLSEVGFLNRFFGNGKLYVVGDVTTDHWYLYTAGVAADKTAPLPPSSEYLLSPPDLPHVRPGGWVDDETFEVLMTELDPACAAQFETLRLPGDLASDASDDLGHICGRHTLQLLGLDRVYPAEAVETHDAFLFTPCGYLSNLMADGRYYTLHVTPEQGWLYALFELTLVPQKYGMTSADVLDKVVSVFRPGKFVCTLIGRDGEVNFRALREAAPKGYVRNERIVYELPGGYTLLYLLYRKA